MPLFVEYRSVLLRSENLLGRSAEQAEGFLDFLLSVSHLQEVFFLWRPVLTDPNDEMVLELAVASGCRYIITHNLKDFQRLEKWGIAAVTLAGFLKSLEN